MKVQGNIRRAIDNCLTKETSIFLKNIFFCREGVFEIFVRAFPRTTSSGNSRDLCQENIQVLLKSLSLKAI